VLNSFNIQVGGTAIGVPTAATADIGALTTASNAAGTDIKSQNDVEVNTFWKLTKTAELGVEYMYETVKTFGTAGVVKSDGSSSNKNTSSKVEVELKFSF